MIAVSDWFTARPVSEGLLLITEPFLDRFLRANVWLISGQDRLLLVDTGFGLAPLRAWIDDRFEDPVVAVVTHAHSDHMGGLHEFAERLAHAAEVDELMRPAHPAGLRASDYEPEFRAEEPCRPTRLIDEGDVIDLGDRRFEVLHLPGHTMGSIGLWDEATGTLFSGDTVFVDAPLLDDFPGSDVASYRRTMQRLRDLPVRVVHAGHELRSVCEGYLDRRSA